MPARDTPANINSSALSVRSILQIIFLVITVLIGIRHILPSESPKGGAFDAFCPFGGIETLWSYLTSGQTLVTTSLLNFSILLGVLGVALLSGRAFCGWMCPLGSLQDFLVKFSERIFRSQKSRSRFHLPYHVTSKNDAWLRYTKYLILGIVLLASVRAVYPPLQEICPVRAIFGFQITSPLLISVVLIFVITSVLNRRFWCKYLCPLGAVLAPFNKISPLRLVLNQESCPSCRLCEPTCPMDIEDLTHNLRSPECIQCLECQEACQESEALELRLF